MNGFEVAPRLEVAHEFEIAPDAPYSLALAASFGFGPTPGRESAELGLAFVADDLLHHAAVRLRQEGAGAGQAATVWASVAGEAPLAVVRRQVERILCLDRPARPWLALGRSDPVLGALQRLQSGFRPVLFHSPYEAAAWAIISTRRHAAQARALRSRLCEAHGRVFELGGERCEAFPLPAALLELDAFPGLDAVRLGRLRTLAAAALEGALDPELLRGLAAGEALDRLRSLPGIGPSYATLVLLRATGATDALTFAEPHLPAYVAHLYRTGSRLASEREIASIAEGWRPYRTWAAVLIRFAGDRMGLAPPPRPGRGRRG